MDKISNRSRKILSAIIVLINHIKQFGYRIGISIFFKTNFKKEGLLSIKLPNLSSPFYLRASTSDIRTFWQVMLSKEYEISLDFVPKVIIDCGANVGLSSLFFISKYPNCKIIAIEPEDSNFAILKENLKSYPNAIPEKCGIWNRVTNLVVSDEYNLGKWGFTVKEATEEMASTVSAITLADVMNRYNIEQIDILKIDIEGSETALFSSNYEYWLSRTRVLIIELHDWLKRGSSRSVLKAITRYDFSVIIQGENLVFIKNL
ncbi:FkbM family methyltransferase [Larkinella sp. VNQ87]|uniref:FkbM family methyltransferase n=1 Tax=Larkinella sp. VNQ87 TaxID=3400921 RepID=UPI003C12B2F3